MNDERIKAKIEEKWEKFEVRRGRGRVWAGLFLLFIGGLLLLKTLNAFVFPVWFFTWPVFLIGVGLFSGVRHGFRKGGGWLVIILIGFLFLLNDMDPSLQLKRYVWPIAIIAVGVMFIVSPKKKYWRHQRRLENGDHDSVVRDYGPSDDSYEIDKKDFIDITSVFGGVKKNVLSKTFKGGDIICIMGGSEINLTQADIEGRIKIDTTNIFGGTKLIVPSNWDVQSEVVTIFGGIDDKRQIGGVNIDPNKILVLEGTCLFGGIEIKSF